MVAMTGENCSTPNAYILFTAFDIFLAFNAFNAFNAFYAFNALVMTPTY
uniref:Uncharacterized protein n=1 Tax=Escherichia coli TaxID=562 RepID=E3PYW5_ECOLX|nr:protein of unknown function [Escherichia coli]